MTSNGRYDDQIKKPRGPGRPRGDGPTSKLLSELKVGDSIILPAKADNAAILYATRNRYYNVSRRLGIKLSYEIVGDNIRVRREA